jgi:2-polyprenyl-3-methyl-5-hydroxy-6-metoxy-1,4-benzoquinol methylase
MATAKSEADTAASWQPTNVGYVSSDFHDAVWRALPEGVVPGDFDARREFLLARVAPGERVLDFGCGGGTFANELAGAGADVVGVDVSAEALRRGRQAYGELDLHQISMGQPLPFDHATFDVVWAGDVLTHILDLAALLSEVRRVLRPDGRFLASALNHSRRAMLTLALSRSRFAEHFDPRSQHVRFFSADTLRDLLSDMGFSDVEVGAAGQTLFASAVRPALGG